MVSLEQCNHSPASTTSREGGVAVKSGSSEESDNNIVSIKVDPRFQLTDTKQSQPLVMVPFLNHLMIRALFTSAMFV